MVLSGWCEWSAYLRRRSDAGGAERVALRNALQRAHVGVAVEGGEHALHHAAVDGTDHGVLDGDLAERAVVVDDAQLVVALVGVRSEPVGAQGVGDGLHRRAQAALAGRQIGAGVFLKLDKAKIPNLANVWPDVQKRLANYDPGNEYAVNYMWGTTGIGYNVNKIKERMPDAPLDSWSMVFDPAIISKFKDCGVMFLDAPDEVIPADGPACR